MSTFLTTVVETYHVDTEHEVDKLVSDAKADTRFVLSRYTSDLKEIKEKREIVDEYYKVTLTKVFTDLKEPDRDVTVSYNVSMPSLILPSGLTYEEDECEEDE